MRHTKKLFILFLIIVLAMLCFTTVSASDETKLVSYPVTGGRILFDSEAGIVTGYEGAITKVDIPSKIDGVDVVTIGYGAFDNCISLSSVVLPDSLTTIEEFAFANCFFLTSVELPDSLTTIGEYAFTCCGDLTAVTIPDSVLTIGTGAFSGCSMLEGIWVDENNPEYCSDQNGIVFSKDKTELIVYPGALVGEYTIPDSVSTIGDSAFSLCYNLTGIIIPDSVTTICTEAFNYCSNLTCVNIPGSVTTIGEYAFAFCDGLTRVIISAGVPSIGDGAFQNCYSLTDVTIPGSVSYIGATSFLNCGSLTDVTIPEGVTTIGAMAFDSCYELTSIEIPASVTTIGFDVFYDCYNLTDIYYGGSEEQWNEIDLDDNDFSSVNIHFNSTMPELVSYAVPGGSILFDPATGTVTDYAGEPTIVDIPEKINGVDVVSINEYAFTSCYSLTEITIPASVANIGVSTFFSCEQLKSIWVSEENPNYSNDKNGVLLSKDKTELVIYPGALASNYTIPSGVTKIGDWAFAYCNALTSITIPDGVTTIGEDTFHGCERLERVEISSTVTTIGECAFLSCNHLKGIWVDENNPNYCSDENGVLFSKDKTELVVCPGALASNYTIPSGVTKIGDWAFAYCNGLTSISIPDGVTTIGDWAFGSCLNLTTATMSDSVTSLGQGIFSSCYSLSNVTISDNITSLSPETFYSCLSLTNVSIPNGVTSIGDYTFVWCERLTTVTIPASVTTISNLAFDVCYKLSTICYGGTPEQWAQVDKDPYEFSGCTIHFCSGANFKDTPIYDNWAHDGIDYCVENELMNGVGGNRFNPNGTVSRAQLVTILYRVAGSPETEFKGTFTDVANGKWYSKAIEWAAANGVVNGIGGGKFAPDQSITREQIATILYRYHGSPTVSGNLNSFPDADSVSGFARNGLLWATQKGLINGVSSGGVISLAPKANATRAQIAAIIMRYCERS